MSTDYRAMVATFHPTHEAEFGTTRCAVLVDAEGRHPRNNNVRVQSVANAGTSLGITWQPSRLLSSWRAIR